MTPTARRHDKLWRTAFAVGLSVLLTSCGGDSDSGSTPVAPTPTATPTPPTPRLLLQRGFALQAPTNDTVYYSMATITDSASGRWEASVDWTFDTNVLWMWVANGACTAEQFNLDACPFEAACPREESGNYRVTLTPTTGVTAEGAASAISPRGASGGMVTGRKALRRPR